MPDMNSNNQMYNFHSDRTSNLQKEHQEWLKYVIQYNLLLMEMGFSNVLWNESNF